MSDGKGHTGFGVEGGDGLGWGEDEGGVDAPGVVLDAGERPGCDARAEGDDDLDGGQVSLRREGAERTSLRPGSTAMQEMAWGVCAKAGKASQKARTRTRARSDARRTRAVSADAYSWTN